MKIQYRVSHPLRREARGSWSGLNPQGGGALAAEKAPTLPTRREAGGGRQLRPHCSHGKFMATIQNVKIGLVGKGEALGREGILSLLVFSTQEEVFVFDILLLAVDGFKYGLFAVLQRPDLIKVNYHTKCGSAPLNYCSRWFMMSAT